MSYNGRVDIWIKQEDRARWDAIENKPEWLHEHLNDEDDVFGSFTPRMSPDDVDFVLKGNVLSDRIKRREKLEIAPEVIIADDPTLTPPEETA